MDASTPSLDVFNYNGKDSFIVVSTKKDIIGRTALFLTIFEKNGNSFSEKCESIFGDNFSSPSVKVVDNIAYILAVTSYRDGIAEAE